MKLVTKSLLLLSLTALINCSGTPTFEDGNGTGGSDNEAGAPGSGGSGISLGTGGNGAGDTGGSNGGNWSAAPP